MKKIFFVLVSGILFFKATGALALCPVCTFAVGAGVGLSRYFGIDDIITGLWIGGLLTSMSLWTIDWLKRKNKKFKGMALTIFAAYYILTIVPLFFTNIMGHPMNTFLGVDRLLAGIIGGSLVFFGASHWYFYLKKNNNDRAYFPFQKVAMTVGGLILVSLIAYFLNK